MRTTLYQVQISDGVKAGNASSQKNSPQGGFPVGIMIPEPIFVHLLFISMSAFCAFLFLAVFLLFLVIALPFARRVAWIQFCIFIPLPILSPIAALYRYSITPYAISAFVHNHAFASYVQRIHSNIKSVRALQFSHHKRNIVQGKKYEQSVPSSTQYIAMTSFS